MKLSIITTGIAAVLMLGACAQNAAVETKSAAISVVNSADETAIKEAVMDYFEGQGQGSHDRLDRAFNDSASMFGVMKNEAGEESLRVWPKMSEVIVDWSKKPNPDAPARDSEIYDIQVTDGRIATVHFRSANAFYDVLTLVKVNGQWEIAAKVFVRQ